MELRRNPIVIAGLIVVLVWLIIALLAPYIAPFEPLKQDLLVRLQSPDSEHYFGTDELGRDIFSRVLYGSRITIPAAFMAIMTASLVGSSVGALAGYMGGIPDEILMRFTELFMAFPIIILAMAIAAALGPSVRNLVLTLVVVTWPNYARIMRGSVLEIKNREYVKAVRSIGAPHWYILLHTIIPNALAPIIVYMTLDIGIVIITFAGLSFLGLGPEPTSPEWGRMVSIGIDFFDQWWMWLFPGLAIASLVLALNFIGDGLRDIIDPHLR
ncbi:MAG: ABC transporter permease [Chloroflexi bacterium]|nr:ABC transporter permease [Chloroflexota bacterium]